MEARFDVSEGADAGFSGQCPTCGLDASDPVEIAALRDRVREAEAKWQDAQKAIEVTCRERDAAMAKASQYRYDIQCAVAHSNRTWCANWTQKHFPMLLAALATPAASEGEAQTNAPADDRGGEG